MSLIMVLTEISFLPNFSALASDSVIDAVSDGDTSGSTYWKNWLMDSSWNVKAGRVWTDKTVFSTDIDNSEYLDVYTKNDDEDFLAVFSAMGSSKVQVTYGPAPIDLMLIVDISTSMGNGASSTRAGASGSGSRMYKLLPALNEAIENIMSTPKGRVGITVYGTRAEVLLPLGRYEKIDLGKEYITMEMIGESASNGNHPFKLVVNAKDETTNTAVSPNYVINGINTSDALAENKVGPNTNTYDGIYKGMSAMISGDVDASHVPLVFLMSDGGANTISNSADHESSNLLYNWWNPNSSVYGFTFQSNNTPNVTTGLSGNNPKGNGPATILLTLMMAAYMKTKVESYYGDGSLKVYTFEVVGSSSGWERTRLDAVLNPTNKFIKNSSNAEIKKAYEWWESWSSQKSTTIKFYRAGEMNGNKNFTSKESSLGYPDVDLSKMIQNLNYVADDGYTKVSSSQISQLLNKFSNIITSNTSNAPHPVLNRNNAADLTYTDPIGKYMEVKDVKAVELFGKSYNVVRKPGTTNEWQIDAPADAIESNPLYPSESPFLLSDIKIRTIDSNKDEYDQELVIDIPESAIPLLIQRADNSTNINSVKPLRVIYSIGMDSRYVNDDTGKVDMDLFSNNDKRNIPQDANGNYLFYANYYENNNECANTVFEANKENTYYANRSLARNSSITKDENNTDVTNMALDTETERSSDQEQYLGNNGVLKVKRVEPESDDGSLCIKKTVETNGTEMDETASNTKFQFSVYLSGFDNILRTFQVEYYKDGVKTSSGTITTGLFGTCEVMLGAGEEIHILGISENTYYRAREIGTYPNFTNRDSYKDGFISEKHMSEVEFINIYTPHTVTYRLNGHKNYESVTNPAVVFEFEVKGSDIGTKTVSVTGSGDITFLNETYDKTGNYTYTITEKKGTANVQYDESSYEVTVTVARSSSAGLTIDKVEITKDGKPYTGDIEFTNYEIKSTDLSFSGKKVLALSSGENQNDLLREDDFTVELVGLSASYLNTASLFHSLKKNSENEEEFALASPSNAAADEYVEENLDPFMFTADDDIISDENIPVSTPSNLVISDKGEEEYSEITEDIFNEDLSKEIIMEISSALDEIENLSSVSFNGWSDLIENNKSSVVPPMPNSASGDTITASNNNSGIFNFGSIHYEKPGIYRYALRELTGSISDARYGDIQYDDTIYLITVRVNVKEKGELEAAYAIETYDGNGNEITIEISGSSMFQFTNVINPKVSLTVKKTWSNDEDFKEITRPENIIVELIKNGEETGNTKILDESNGWTESFKNLPKYDSDGSLCDYSVIEKDISDSYESTIIWLNKPAGYDSEIGPNELLKDLVEFQYQIINSLVRKPTVSISVNKEWNDEEIRHPDVKIHLIRKGISSEEKIDTVTLPIIESDGTKSWHKEWTDLERYEDAENEYTYYLKEDPVSGYRTDIVLDKVSDEGDSYQYTVRNTQTTSVRVKKSWDTKDATIEIPDNSIPDEIIMTLYRDGFYMDSQILNGNGSKPWEYLWEDLDKYDEDGNKITYTVKEESGYWTKDEGTDGWWKFDRITGTGTEADPFVIHNTYDEEVTSKSVRKEWDDFENELSLRPESIEVYLHQYKGEEESKVLTETLTSGSTEYTWNNLSKYYFEKEDGIIKRKEYRYEIDESEDYDNNKYYEASYSDKDGITVITNKLLYAKIRVAKWIDNAKNYSDYPDLLQDEFSISIQSENGYSAMPVLTHSGEQNESENMSEDKISGYLLIPIDKNDPVHVEIKEMTVPKEYDAGYIYVTLSDGVNPNVKKNHKAENPYTFTLSYENTEKEYIYVVHNRFAHTDWFNDDDSKLNNFSENEVETGNLPVEKKVPLKREIAGIVVSSSYQDEYYDEQY